MMQVGLYKLNQYNLGYIYVITKNMTNTADSKQMLYKFMIQPFNTQINWCHQELKKT